MRNLLLLIVRYNYILYFAVLQIICAFLIIQNNNFHKSTYINSSRNIIGGLYNKYSGLKDYLDLRNQNMALAEENSMFRSKQFNLHKVPALDSLKIMANDTVIQYSYKVARVVNNSINKRMNYLTINKGSTDGIKKEMGVIDQRGIVGVVNNVSENYATIRSILHKESMISAGLKNSSYYGSLVWERNNSNIVRLKDIPKHAKIQIGDTVVTTAYSSIFPEGISIGTVSEVFEEDVQNFKELDIKLINDLANVVYVYVIENKEKQEKLDLEKLNDN